MLYGSARIPDIAFVRRELAGRAATEGSTPDPLMTAEACCLGMQDVLCYGTLTSRGLTPWLPTVSLTRESSV